MFAHRSTFGPVDLAFTDRYGGVSAAPFDSLDLSLTATDSPAGSANLERVLAQFAPGAALADMHQVHGREVTSVDGARRCEADALVTTQPDLVLMVRVADCVPVLLADESGSVIAAVHAGRPGMALGVVEAAVERMRSLGADRIRAWLGPHVCGQCYEVPQSMQAEIAELEPTTVSTTRWGTPAIDVAAGVVAQLERAQVQVESVGGCTMESEDYFSYRRDGDRSGRMVGLIRRHR